MMHMSQLRWSLPQVFLITLMPLIPHVLPQDALADPGRVVAKVEGLCYDSSFSHTGDKIPRSVVVPLPAKQFSARHAIPLELGRGSSVYRTSADCIATDGRGRKCVLAQLTALVPPANSCPSNGYEMLKVFQVDQPRTRAFRLADVAQETLEEGFDFVAFDSAENEYRAHIDLALLESDNEQVKVLSESGERKSFRVETPLLPVGNGSEQHPPLEVLLGISTYITVYRKTNAIEVQAVIHNGYQNAGPDWAKPNKLVYVREMSVRFPEASRLTPIVEQPAMRDEGIVESGTRSYSLMKLVNRDYPIRPNGVVKHRFVLHPAGDTEMADLLNRGLQTLFPKPGTNPDRQKLWDWGNRRTAHFFGNQMLPKFPTALRNSLRAEIKGDTSELLSVFESGDGTDNFGTLLSRPTLGQLRLCGANFNMTGDEEIHPFWDVPGLRSFEPHSILKSRLLNLCIEQRMFNYLVRWTGDPTASYQWRTSNGYNPEPYLSGAPKSSYYASRPGHLIELTQANDRVPPYLSEYEGITPIDWNHLIRALKYVAFLAYTTNDLAAIDRLHSLSQAARRFNSEIPFGPNYPGPFVNTVNAVSADPGKGGGFGRATGWTAAAHAAHFRFANRGQRRELKRYLDFNVRLWSLAQIPCNGILESKYNHYFPDFNEIAQAYEAAFMAFGMHMLHENVYKKSDREHAEMLSGVIRKMVQGMSGNEDESVWVSHNALGERKIARTISTKNADGEVYCSGNPPRSSQNDNSYFPMTSIIGYQHRAPISVLEANGELSGMADWFWDFHDYILDTQGEGRTPNLHNNAGIAGFMQWIARED
ncbi:MAG: hypothetical protein KDD55_04890 [Bdellovibrionales bacterium]|nr:hypothetical protein [Bdellovibrionales bacterium]